MKCVSLKQVYQLVLSASILVYGYGCDTPLKEETGNAAIGVHTAAISSDDITGITVTVTGEQIDPAIVSELVLVDDLWQGTIESIPAGPNRTFTVEAVNAEGSPLYSGITKGITIVQGETVNVQIFLQQATPPNPFENSAPRFTTMIISSTAVGPLETVSIRAEAVDPDPTDSLEYRWTADDGTFDSDDIPEVVWTAPSSAGSFRLSVTVTDSKGSDATLSTIISVTDNEETTGAASIEANLNTWPQIEKVNASPTQLDEGDTATLSLMVTDPDEDALSYNWEASCDGLFNDPGLQNPTFTLMTLPDNNQDCILHVEVLDGNGGANQAALSLATGPLPFDNATPLTGGLFSTGFEPGDPTFVNLKSSGDVSTNPPEGTEARSGSSTMTLSSITTTYQGRDLQSNQCISLKNDQDVISANAYGMSSSANGANEISARLELLWFVSSNCDTAHDEESSAGKSTVLEEGQYQPITIETLPPQGATHMKIRIGVRDNNGGENLGDDFAVDDLVITQ